MHPGNRCWFILLALLLASATPGLGQDHAIRRNHLGIDVGMLQGGLSYARRVGQSKLSVGGGIWGAWEPWNSFESPVLEAAGVELFLRAHPSPDAHFEVGPSLLRYQWADDCSECSATLTGIRAAGMVGKGVFSLGPTVRLGYVTGTPSGNEIGVLWGLQFRLLFSWGE
jgi:hypothetical protein